MKKIIVLTLLLALLTSCNSNEKIGEEVENIKNKINSGITEEIVENITDSGSEEVKDKTTNKGQYENFSKTIGSAETKDQACKIVGNGLILGELKDIKWDKGFDIENKGIYKDNSILYYFVSIGHNTGDTFIGNGLYFYSYDCNTKKSNEIKKLQMPTDTPLDDLASIYEIQYFDIKNNIAYFQPHIIVPIGNGPTMSISRIDLNIGEIERIDLYDGIADKNNDINYSTESLGFYENKMLGYSYEDSGLETDKYIYGEYDLKNKTFKKIDKKELMGIYKNIK